MNDAAMPRARRYRRRCDAAAERLRPRLRRGLFATGNTGAPLFHETTAQPLPEPLRDEVKRAAPALAAFARAVADGSAESEVVAVAEAEGHVLRPRRA